MKKALYIISLGLLLLAEFSSCKEKEDPQPLESVDLRYRAYDSYDLDAVSPQAFTIVVKSTKPWTVRSYHPDWCIISDEEGEAQPADLVHVGKGENTNIKIQYYDNTGLDDRTDKIEIASFGFIGKVITVNQKGTAYLRVPAEEQEFMVEKAGGDVVFHILSNQPWSTKVLEIEGDWLSIPEGETGELDGTVTLRARENTGEKRYASVAVYDRLGEERAIIKLTQDGVQLDPEAFEIRVGYDQLSASLNVVANAKWTAEKGGEDDWFTIDNPTGHNGDDVLMLTFKDNAAGDVLRKSTIILKTVPANEGDAVAEKVIAVKQAYPIVSQRVIMDNDNLDTWGKEWDNPPVYTKDVGTLFAAKSRVHNGSMPFGTYTFHWKDWVGGARIRHWFCFSDGIEMKMDIRPIDAKISYDFNASSSGTSTKPSVDAYTDVDWSKPIEVTYKFDPSGSEFCHVTYLVNGVVAGSFDTSASVLHTVTWGTNINMYIGVDQVSGQAAGSAILEWYDYTPTINWDD